MPQSQPIGVLALQGAFGLHVEACRSIGREAIEVRTPAELDRVDRLIIPGGESTTMSMMLARNNLLAPLRQRINAGMAVFGTCAGMILLASKIEDGRSDQLGLAAIDITVKRNGYGRQNQSFVTDLELDLHPEVDSHQVVSESSDVNESQPFEAAFIRAPRITRLGNSVSTLAELDGDPVLCRSGSVLVASFHPELSKDLRLHQYFSSLS